MTTNYLTPDDMRHACRELESGRHGSFAQDLARAYFHADKTNSDRLASAFPEIFERGYHFYQSNKLRQIPA
jgi:hypothetical protein